jgi:hypothetical protein
VKRLEPSIGRDLGYLRAGRESKKEYIGPRFTQMNTDLYMIIKKNISISICGYINK